MTDLDNEIESIEGGKAWDETDEVVQIEVKKPLDKVIPVRLSSDKWEELRQEAKSLGLGPTTLARMWIMERLRQPLIVGYPGYFEGMTPRTIRGVRPFDVENYSKEGKETVTE